MPCKRLLRDFLARLFDCGGLFFSRTKAGPVKIFRSDFFAARGRKAQDGAGANAVALGIGPIKFPGYLDRQQFVTRISQNRFAIAENDRWAEPLDENFTRVLAQNISILLPTDRIVTYPWERSQQPTYQVQMEVLRFEPSGDGVVELSARWSIMDSAKKTLRVSESSLTQPAREKSTEASVVSMSQVVSELSKEIADAIRALPIVQAP